MKKKLLFIGDIIFYLVLLTIAFLTLIGSMRLTVVHGGSMEPTLHDGEIRLVIAQEPEVGDVVIAWDGSKYLVKRVDHIRKEDGALWLLGDNTENSLDSRVLGYFSRDQIKWVVFMPEVRQ